MKIKNRFNFFKEIKKFKNNNDNFIIDEFSNEKISFDTFLVRVKELKEEIKLYQSNKVYLLQLTNKIDDFILLVSFILAKKKIILYPKTNKNKFDFLKKYNLPICIIFYKNKKIKKKNLSNQKIKDRNFDILIMSSGSTGLSKLVKLKMNKSILNSSALAKLCKFTKFTTHLMIMPIYHVNALFFSFLSSLISSQKLIISSNFSIIDFWKIVNQYKVNSVSVSPTIVRLLNKFKFQKTKNLTLTKVICASTFLSKIEYKKFKRNFDLFISQGYGLSEATNFSTLMPTNQKELNEINNFFNKEKYISIGRSIKNHSIKLSKEKFKNGSKEFIVQGEYLSNGYYDIDKSEPKNIKTGDLGYFKKYKNQKYFFITGRKKEIIKFRDETLFPIDIETKMQAILENLSFFCFGFKHKNLEEIGCIINKADFNKSIKKKIEKIGKTKDYEYYPSFFFIGDIKNYLTKTNKPKRNYISDIVSKKFFFKEIGHNIFLI